MSAMERNAIPAGPIGSETGVVPVNSMSELVPVLGVLLECSVPIGVDVETTGLNPRCDRLRLISVATGKKTFVVDVDRVRPEDLLAVLHEKSLVFHNAAFDLSFLRRYIPGFGKTVFDTMLP